MDCTQKKLDYHRAEQLHLLRELQCGDVSVDCGCRRIKVKAVNLKAVLRQIDDYAREAGECYASQQTLADKTGLSRETTKRVLKALTELSLITCDFKRNPLGSVTNHYRIVWSELELLVTKTTCAVSPSVSSPEQTVSSPCATVSSRVTYKPPLNAMKRKPPPTSSSLFDPPASSSAPDPEWQEVEEAVAAQGVEDWHAPVSAVRKRGVVPEKVLLLVGHFARHKQAQGWGPGVLYRRLLNTTRDCVVTAHWPVVPGKGPEPKAESGQRKASVQQGCLVTSAPVASPSSRGDAEDVPDLLKRTAAARQQQSAEQAAAAQLERAIGPALDRLDAEALEALVQRTLGGNVMLLRLYRKNGCAKPSMVREALLEQLQREGG